MTNLIKYISTIIILHFSFNNIYGQTVALENIRENNLTIGIDNEIIVAVENVPCAEIEIKTTNGLVKATENKCHFIVVPLNDSKTTIEIYRRINDQLNFLDKKEFKITSVR